MERRIAITGVGPVSSIGIGKKDFWRGVCNGSTNVKEENFVFDGESYGKFFLHKISNFSIKKFDINAEKLSEMYFWKEKEGIKDLDYMLASIKLAINDSKIQYNITKNNIGLVAFHENLGLGQFYNRILDLIHKNLTRFESGKVNRTQILNLLYSNLQKAAYDLQTFTSLFHITKVFDLHGFSLFINNACCSGLYALEVASDIIKSGKCNVVIVSGADSPDVFKYFWFKNLNLYSPDGIIRPFSKDRNGLVFGEGGGAIVLEDFESAVRRKANIYAEYIAGGFISESWKMNFPTISENYYSEAIKIALRRSKLDISELDFLCPHAIGTKIFDEYEANNLAMIFGKNFNKPLVSAFKPYIGHNLGLSALIETIILVLSMKNKLIPSTLNCSNIDEDLNIRLVEKNIKKNCRFAMKTCSSFAGYDGASVFKSI